MQTERNKWIGVTIMIVGLILCALSFWYFKLDGQVISYTNARVFLGFVLSYLSLLAGLYFGLRFYANKKVANQIGRWGLAVLIIAILIDFIKSWV